MAVQPLSPVFLYAHNRDELRELSPTFAHDLRRLRGQFRQLARTGPEESQVLVLRVLRCSPASVRSPATRHRRTRPLLR